MRAPPLGPQMGLPGGHEMCDVLNIEEDPVTQSTVAYSIDFSGLEVYTIKFKYLSKEVDINGNAKMLALNIVKGDINKMNTFEFKKMFMADKMYTVIKDLDSWLNNSFNALNAYTSL